MPNFTRHEIAEILELDVEFVTLLEREAILFVDVPELREAGATRSDPPVFSPRMLERARVAYSLVDELGVNLAGVAVILRMREDLGLIRTRVRTLASAMQEKGKGKLP